MQQMIMFHVKHMNAFLIYIIIENKKHVKPGR